MLNIRISPSEILHDVDATSLEVAKPFMSTWCYLHCRAMVDAYVQTQLEYKNIADAPKKVPYINTKRNVSN